VLLQKVREGLVSELLKVLHAVLGEKVESVPSLVIELNALARHSGILLRDNSATLWHFPGRQARDDGPLHPRRDRNDRQDREPARWPECAAPQACETTPGGAAGAVTPPGKPKVEDDNIITGKSDQRTNHYNL
jgi:hypothetical protein